MTHEQFQQFLYSNARNQWLESLLGKVYVRKSVHTFPSFPHGLRCLDIASIETADHNIGVFTAWYPGIRQIAINFGADAVFFESVLNKHFARKLARMGMQKVEDFGYVDLLK